MRVKFDTDDRKVVIDTNNINQFYPVELNRSVIEHDTDGADVSVLVNCSLPQIAECICQSQKKENS